MGWIWVRVLICIKSSQYGFPYPSSRDSLRAVTVIVHWSWRWKLVIYWCDIALGIERRPKEVQTNKWVEEENGNLDYLYLRIKPEGWKLGPIIDITKEQKANRNTQIQINKPFFLTLILSLTTCPFDLSFWVTLALWNEIMHIIIALCQNTCVWLDN